MIYRIGLFIVMSLQATTYQDAGVSIDQGNALVQFIKPLVARTARPGALGRLEGFSSVFNLSELDYKDPFLFATTDGVGSKVKIAQQFNKHNSIGIDLVAMNLNDLIVHGAEPLFFLDYFATSYLQLDQAKAIIEGIARACKDNNCALIGGETSEMPGMYQEGEYDVAGFAVGIVERQNMLPRLTGIEIGNAVIGIASSGIHSNGYSLVRHIIEKNNLSLDDAPAFASPHATLGNALLEPTIIYVQALLPLIRDIKLEALAHITGGGLLENIPRVLPDDFAVHLDMRTWPIPPIFTWLAHIGNIPAHDMLRTFNCGIGMVAIAAQENAPEIITHLKKYGHDAWVIGLVKEREKEEQQVIIENAETIFRSTVSWYRGE